MRCNDITALSSQFQKGGSRLEKYGFGQNEPKDEEHVALNSKKHNKPIPISFQRICFLILFRMGLYLKMFYIE